MFCCSSAAPSSPGALSSVTASSYFMLWAEQLLIWQLASSIKRIEIRAKEDSRREGCVHGQQSSSVSMLRTQVPLETRCSVTKLFTPLQITASTSMLLCRHSPNSSAPQVPHLELMLEYSRSPQLGCACTSLCEAACFIICKAAHLGG